jgi:hypothetical protein
VRDGIVALLILLRAGDPSIAPAASSPAQSQSRARRAFVRVSSVVKVLDATTTSVVSGSRSFVFAARSKGSMLETNRAEMPASAYGSRAAETIAGPRSDPPIPMFTTVSTFLPVMPVHSPERTRSAKAAMALRTDCTSASTSWPSTLSAGRLPVGEAPCGGRRGPPSC